jgi:acetate CoA/acetoacetate CoA-transferase beta subunit
VTALRRVDLVVTDLAVIKPTPEGLLLVEVAPGVTPTQVISATAAKLTVPEKIPEMAIDG